MQPIGMNNKNEGRLIESLLSGLLRDADWLQSEQVAPPAQQVHSEPTFTLSQIVENAKDCVEWEEARSIVWLLNRMLRRRGSRKDFELVDSIEQEFRNRRMMGIQVKNAEIEVKSPGNYIAHNITRK